jgi:hypothetical protein
MLHKSPRWYVGCRRNGAKVPFKTCDPSERANGRAFFALIGPFRTRRGAEYMAAAGRSPTCLTVHDAEELAKLTAR